MAKARLLLEVDLGEGQVVRNSLMDFDLTVIEQTEVAKAGTGETVPALTVNTQDIAEAARRTAEKLGYTDVAG